MSVVVPRDVWERAQVGHLATWRAFAEKERETREARAALWGAILAEMARVAPVRTGERILDVGCGLDTCLDFVREPVHGVTCDTLMARLREFGLSPGLRHTAGALEALPFREGAFDRVFLMNVLDHVYDAPSGLRELARVLVPTGTLVLSVDVYEGRRYVTKRLHKWFARLRGARTKHPLVFSERSVARRLRAAGFALAHVAHVAGTKSRRRLFVARRL